jgi:hypothetical protein
MSLKNREDEMDLHMKQTLRCLLAAALMLGSGLTFAGGISSGNYALRTLLGSQLDFRRVYMAEDDGKISGFFDNPFTRPANNDLGENLTCRFFFSGSTRGDGSIRLDTWYPDEQTGHIETGSPIVLREKSGAWMATVTGDLPNCDAPTIETGDFLTLDKPEPWKSIGYINKSRSLLYSGPNEGSRTKGYLVRSDPVALLQGNSEWLHITYIGHGSNLSRWLKRPDLTQR